VKTWRNGVGEEGEERKVETSFDLSSSHLASPTPNSLLLSHQNILSMRPALPLHSLFSRLTNIVSSFKPKDPVRAIPPILCPALAHLHLRSSSPLLPSVPSRSLQHAGYVGHDLQGELHILFSRMSSS